MKNPLSARICLIWLLLFGAPGILWAAPDDVPLPVPQHVLTLQIRDNASRPLEARVSVRESHGAFLPPADPSIPFHRSYIKKSFFYADGEVDVLVPAGSVRVVVSRGPEYSVFDQTIQVERSQNLSVTLRRVLNPNGYGFWSGDTHTHIAHGGYGDVFKITPEDLALVQRAEGVNVVCALSNGLHFNGGLDPASRPDYLLHFGVEYRSALYGHMGLLGLSNLVPFGCCLPGDPAVPTNKLICDLARAQNAIVVSAHPVSANPNALSNTSAAWPWSGMARELPANVLAGRIDAFDLFSYSNVDQKVARDLWFDLLNLGKPLPLSVGTDASVNRVFDPPLGGYRVYVNTGGPLDFRAWLDGLKAGRSFATNGPLITQFLIAGVYTPGDTWRRTQKVSVAGQIRILTRDPVNRLELYAGGTLLGSYTLPATTGVVDYTFNVNPPLGSLWLVARVTGPTQNDATVGNTLEAITSPIYIKDTEVPVPRQTSQTRFDLWLTELQDIVRARTGWSHPDQMPQVVGELEDARLLLFGKRTPDPDRDLPLETTTETDAPRVSRATLRVISRSAEGIHLQLEGAGSAVLEVFDIRGARIHEGAETALPGQALWPDPAHPKPPAGVYFARLRSNHVLGPALRLIWTP